MSALALRASGVTKSYPGHPVIHALRGVDLNVSAGERVAVVGRSGSGKSTLLNIVGLLDLPSSGVVEVLGQDAVAMSAAQRDRFRAEALGFVFQESHILGHRTVAENLEIRSTIGGVRRSDRARMAREVLERVGLAGRTSSLGRLLSGGEKQRLAVARAVLTRPRLLLADEPTGNLDEENARAILELFDEQAAFGVGVVVITHDPRVAAWADRAVRLVDGVILGEAAA